jgi:hypothetical protein
VILNENEIRQAADRCHILAKPRDEHREALWNRMLDVLQQTKDRPSIVQRVRVGTRFIGSTMNTSRGKVFTAVAAALVAAVVLTATFWSRPSSVAYALQQTLEALKDAQLVHMTGTYNLPASASDGEKAVMGTSGRIDFWASRDPEGPDSKDAKMVMTCGQNRFVMGTNGDQTYRYISVNNSVTYTPGKQIMSSPWPGTGLFEVIQKHAKQASILYGGNAQSGQPSILVTASIPSTGQSYWFQLDAQSKLPIHIKQWQNVDRQGPAFIDADVTYSDSIPAGLFDFEPPADANVIHEQRKDPASSCGLPTVGLTPDDASRQVVREYLQAMVEGNWNRAHILYPALSEQEHASHYAGNGHIVEVLEVGQPHKQDGCAIGPVVPCKVRLADGATRDMQLIVEFRTLGDRPCCLIVGTWGKA